MYGLPTELYSCCRSALLQCSELDSNASLRAVFATEGLVHFRSEVPEATSKKERVERCLEFLLTKRLSDGHPALIVFLATLRDGYQSGDALHDELGDLVTEVESALSSPGAYTRPQNVSKITPSSLARQIGMSVLQLRQLDIHAEHAVIRFHPTYGDLIASAVTEISPDPSGVTQPVPFLAHTTERAYALDEVLGPLSTSSNPALWTEAEFVGREQIIQHLMDAVDTTRMFMILGIPGIGKTALLTQVAAQLDPDCVFGYRFRPGLISLRDVLIDVARFLNGRPGCEGVLSSLLQTIRFSEAASTDLIIQTLNKNHSYLFFDAVHHVGKQPALSSFFTLLKEQLEQGAVFIASRSKPSFCSPLDESNGIVMQLELDGLHEAEISEFFKRKGISRAKELAQLLDRPFGALPLALELMVPRLAFTMTDLELTVIAEQATEQVVDHLFAEAYEQLSPSERQLLLTASLLIFPFSRGELLTAHQSISQCGNPQPDFVKLRSHLLIHRFASDLYQVHEVIRELAEAYSEELDRHRLQLADYLVATAPEVFEHQLEAVALYCQAGAFDQAAELLALVVDQGLSEYDPDLSESLLTSFREDTVNPQQWMWLVGSRGALAHLRRQYDKAEEQYLAMLQLAERLEDEAGQAVALQRIGNLELHRDHAAAERQYREALRLKQRLDDPEGQAGIHNNLGLLYIEQGRFAEAEMVLEEGLKLLESAQAPQWQKLSLLSNLAYLHATQENWKKANELTELALEIAEDMGSPCDVARLTYNLGMHRAWQGDVEEAQECHIEALRIAQNYSCWEIEELAHIALGRRHDESGNYDEAIACFGKVADIRQKLGDQSGLASITFDIGTFHWHKGDVESALDWYERGIALFGHLANDEQVSLYLHNIYGLAAQSGAPRRLLQSLKCLKEELKEGSLSYSLAEVYGTMGQIYLSILDRERVGLACLRQRINLLDQVDHKHELTEALAEFGAICSDLRLFGEALDASTRAIELADALDLSQQAAHAYYSRANCYANLDVWQQAEDDYRRSLELTDQSSNVDLREQICHNLGEVYRRQGRSQEAIELLGPSLAYARERDDVEDQIKTLNNLGLAYESLTQDEKALAHFHEAVELCKQHGLKRDESNVLISLGNLYLHRQDPQQAKHRYEQALVAARAAQDPHMEEGSIISLSYAHRQLGTFEDIADDFKAIAQRAGDLQHYDNLLQLLTIAGEINVEEGEMEAVAEMFEQALIVAAWMGQDSLQRLSSRVEAHVHFAPLFTIVAHICTLIDQALQDPSVDQARAFYDSMAYRLQRSEYWDSEDPWLFGLIRPIGDYLDEQPNESAWEYVVSCWAQKGIWETSEGA